MFLRATSGAYVTSRAETSVMKGAETSLAFEVRASDPWPAPLPSDRSDHGNLQHLIQGLASFAFDIAGTNGEHSSKRERRPLGSAERSR